MGETEYGNSAVKRSDVLIQQNKYYVPGVRVYS